MSDDAGYTLLSRVPLFAGLDSSVLQEIMREAQTRPAEAGETFFEEGDPATSCFVVRRGLVKLTHSAPRVISSSCDRSERV